MATKPKSYFLTVDEIRKLRAEGIKRPGDFVRAREQASRLKKEKTAVLSARVAVSALIRFKNSLGYNYSGTGKDFGVLVEDAMLLYMAFNARYARQVELVCSEDSILRNTPLLNQLNGKRRKGRVGKNSVAYQYRGSNLIDDMWKVTVELPPVRNIEARVELLQKLFSMADEKVKAQGLPPERPVLTSNRGR